MLVERDIGKGDVCAIIMRHNKILYPLYLATVCVGAIPAVLAYPNPRLHPDKFRQGIDGMSLRSGLDWVFTERDLEETIRPSLERPGSTIKGLHFPLEWKTGHALTKEQLDRVITRHKLMKRDDRALERPARQPEVRQGFRGPPASCRIRFRRGAPASSTRRVHRGAGRLIVRP